MRELKFKQGFENKNIVLIGMPGCGKTTIGKMIAEETDRKLIDVDEYISFTEKKSIEEIFQIGEKHFRDVENKAISELSERQNIIISTGGGVVKNPLNIELLRKNGIIFFIDRPVDKIIQDIDTDSRPLLKNNIKNLYSLYEERYPLYTKYAEYIVKNIDNLPKAISDILTIILT